MPQPKSGPHRASVPPRIEGAPGLGGAGRGDGAVRVSVEPEQQVVVMVVVVVVMVVVVLLLLLMLVVLMLVVLVVLALLLLVLPLTRLLLQVLLVGLDIWAFPVCDDVLFVDSGKVRCEDCSFSGGQFAGVWAQSERAELTLESCEIKRSRGHGLLVRAGALVRMHKGCIEAAHSDGAHVDRPGSRCYVADLTIRAAGEYGVHSHDGALFEMRDDMRSEGGYDGLTVTGSGRGDFHTSGSGERGGGSGRAGEIRGIDKLRLKESH